MVKYKCKWDI